MEDIKPHVHTNMAIIAFHKLKGGSAYPLSPAHGTMQWWYGHIHANHNATAAPCAKSGRHVVPQAITDPSNG